jgi:hypothetical protein
MPDPLPAETVVRLRTDSTFALAAALILAGSFPDLVRFALGAFPAGGEYRSKPDGVERPARGNGVVRVALHAAPRSWRPAAKRDAALLAVMRAHPDVTTLAEIIRLGRRPRTSTVASLKRLEEAGHVEHRSKGVYVAVDTRADSGLDPGIVEPPPARPEGSVWVAPLSGKHRARQSALGEVRDLREQVA